MSVFLHAWARAYVRSLYSCVRKFILAYANLFLRLCVRGNGPVYARSCLCTWALTRVCETSSKSSTLPIFTYFSSVSLPCAILTHLFVIFASAYHYILFLSSFLLQNIIISKFCLNQESNVIFFFVVIISLCW